MHYNAWPARRHVLGTLFASTAAAVAAGVVYKAVYFSVAGTLNVVDSQGNKVALVGAVGTTYPVQCYGGVTGSGTTLLDEQFVLLFD